MYVLMKEKKAIVDKKYSFAQGNVALSTFSSFQGYLVKTKGHMETIDNVGYTKESITAALNDLCKSKVAECEQVSAEGVQHYRAKKVTALEDAKQALQPTAGGAANGGGWADHLPEGASWDTFETECKQNLLQNEYLVSALPEMRKKVMSDRAI